ncbi:unnamed protein product [Sympodiomycopsis kandeliae]
MLRSQLYKIASRSIPSTRATQSARCFVSSPSIWTDKKLKPGQVDEHARIFDPDARKGTAAEATSPSQGRQDFTESRPVDISTKGSNKSNKRLDEHARIFDPDARAGTAAEATASGGSHDFAQSRPVDISTKKDNGSNSPAPGVDAGSGVDPGYASPSADASQPSANPPSTSSDPFPLPFSSSINLSSASQSDQLEDYGAPIRVPGRENGNETRETRIRRLIYQTRKRGILETDLLMSTFANENLWNMSEEEIEEFDRLLDEPDWDIYYWLVNKKPVPDRWKECFETQGRLGYRLRIHTKNEERELRRMPGEGPQEIKGAAQS